MTATVTTVGNRPAKTNENGRRATAAFLTTAPDEKIPVKVRANYDGPVPAAVCEYLADRIIGCAKGGCFYPTDPLDAYGEIWQKLERCAGNLPTLKTAKATTYLRKTVDNLLRKYFERNVKPLREDYRATEGRLDKAENAAGRGDLDAPEGKDVGYAASAAGAEGFDYALGRIGDTAPLTAQQLSERLASRPDARERRLRAAFVLNEVYETIRVSECAERGLIVRAFQAYVTAEGNMVEAAHLAKIGKTKFYKSWNRWLKVAKQIAEKSGVSRN